MILAVCSYHIAAFKTLVRSEDLFDSDIEEEILLDCSFMSDDSSVYAK